MRRRTLLAALPIASLRPDSARAQALPLVRIGVLWDRSGVGAATSGLDQIVAARLAVDDFGQFSRGYPIELLDAEFERRPDQATDIARRWFDHEGVAAIVDLPSTSAAIQVQDLARSRGRTVLNTSSFSTTLTGSACSPTATHWFEDTRALTMAMTLGLAAEEKRTWFLIAPDDLTGGALLTDATAAIELTGGRVIGIARHPPEASTFTSALIGARDSTAAAVGLCAVGSSLTTQIKEGRSLGLFDKGKAICAYAASIKDIHAIGPREARALWITSGFYWNRNERTRSFSHRFAELTGRMPDKPYAATYAAVGHFLRAVETLDTIDGLAVNVGMRRESVYFFGSSGRIRIDGTLLLDVGLYRVKAPDQISEPWDYYTPVRIIPAVDVYRGLTRNSCSLSP